MKIVLGIGNIGEKYKNTRHNAGFLFLDYFTKKTFGENFKEEKKFFGEIFKGNIFDEEIIFLKPNTFVNLSGKALEAVKNFFKIEIKDILIIFDDKDTNFGEIKFREKGGSGGHNGIKDISTFLKTETFSRIKIGIKDEEKLLKMETSDFVLSKFSEEELKKLGENIFPESEKIFLEWLNK